jgi:hypothetical protein
MNTYSIASDSPRWWWPSAAAGAVGSAAVAAILVIPTNGLVLLDRTTPVAPPTLTTSDPWVTTADPSVGGQCFALSARWNAALVHASPRCGHRPVAQHPGKDGVRRPRLDSRP